MSEVLLINPRRRRKKKAAAKKRTPKRAGTRKVTRKSAPKRKTTTKRRAPKKVFSARRTTKKGDPPMAKKRKKRATRRKARRNPSPRKYTRRAARRARSAFSGLNFKGALKNVCYLNFGMFASKWLAKRFGAGASETDPESWGWREYLQGSLGAVAAGFLAQMVKPGSGQKVMEGGLALMTYEMFQNELIAPNAWAAGQFGAGEEDEYYGYVPGDVEQDETGRSYLLGQGGQWQALPEEGYGSSLQPVGPLGQLEPVGPLGEDDDPYKEALLG